jgi:hypothetical protein
MNIEDSLPHPHFGAFCRIIRESLQIDIQPLVAQYQIVHTSLSRNFERRGKLPQKDVFEKYLDGLQNRNLSKIRIALGKDHAELLRMIYEKEGKAIKQQTEKTLQAIRLETIRDRPDSVLQRMVDEMKRPDANPSWICDQLGVIHAANGAMWHMFSVLNEEPDYLNTWMAWNVQGTKYYENSPLRRNQRDYAEYLPQSLNDFFEGAIFSGTLFTLPMKNLLKEILSLSDPHNYKFREWWFGVTTFTIPKRESVTRSVKDPTKKSIKPIRFFARERQYYNGTNFPAEYMYGEWIPLGSEAEGTIRELRRWPKYYDIFYAADYQRKSERPFHPAQW